MEITPIRCTDPLNVGVRETEDSRCLQGLWLATGIKERGGRLLPKQISGRRPGFRHINFEMPADILLEMSNGQMENELSGLGSFFGKRYKFGICYHIDEI